MGNVRGVVALSVLIIVSACSPSATPIKVGGTTVTYTGSPPAECPRREVAEAVRAFLDAFNRGDQQALRQIFQRSVIFSAQNPPPSDSSFRAGSRRCSTTSHNATRTVRRLS